ncbi:MAG: PPC domain-containing DNA-binding protein [Desulfosudaceae bacterium]
MELMTCHERQPRRRFMGRLPHGRDMVAAIEEFCVRHGISSAVFSAIGAVSSATLGAYDQQQQVYVTFQKSGNLEILTCLGNVSLKDGQPMAHAHITLATEDGTTLGGHLFSETIVFAGEIELEELAGPDLVREYDPVTGLMLWDMSGPEAL